MPPRTRHGKGDAHSQRAFCGVHRGEGKSRGAFSEHSIRANANIGVKEPDYSIEAPTLKTDMTRYSFTRNIRAIERMIARLTARIENGPPGSKRDYERRDRRALYFALTWLRTVQGIQASSRATSPTSIED